jgi:hypothetical protein
MKNAILLILAITLVVLATLLVSAPGGRLDYNHYVDSTILVLDHDMSSMGASTMLASGCLLSAYHIFDMDNDNVLTDAERMVNYSGSAGEIHSATIIWPKDGQKTIDAVVIKPDIPIASSTIYVGGHNPDIGTQLFVLGFPGQIDKPHIYFGCQSTDSRKSHSRASVNMEHGVSGGGMFNQETGELIGVATNMRMNPDFPFVTLPNWSEYVTIQDIRQRLAVDSMEFVLDARPTSSVYTKNTFILCVIFSALWSAWLTYCVIYGYRAYRGY